MFSLNVFIKNGLLDAVGKMADYQVILNAAGWHEKGVLTEEELSEISAAIEEKKLAHQKSRTKAAPPRKRQLHIRLRFKRKAAAKRGSKLQ